MATNESRMVVKGPTTNDHDEICPGAAGRGVSVWAGCVRARGGTGPRKIEDCRGPNWTHFAPRDRRDLSLVCLSDFHPINIGLG